jgi:hypothetical protein
MGKTNKIHEHFGCNCVHRKVCTYWKKISVQLDAIMDTYYLNPEIAGRQWKIAARGIESICRFRILPRRKGEPGE